MNQKNYCQVQDTNKNYIPSHSTFLRTPDPV